MSKWLLLPALALAYVAVPATADAPGDRDRDGLPDRWEKRNGLSAKQPSAKSDPDHDGLRNRRELRLRTSPRRADTDGDGLRDGAEVRRYRTNPRRRDTDRDGLGDRREIRRYRTNPRKRDTDGDGYSDLVEIRAGTNPRKRSSHPSSPPGSGPGRFPNPASTGVPAGWTPSQTRTSDLVVTQAGAVVADVLLRDADLIVSAPNVTIRRVKLEGGVIDNWPGGGSCSRGTVIEDSTIDPPPGASESDEDDPAIGVGGYTARRVKIWRRTEGFRVGGVASGCGPVRIEDSFAKIVIPNGRCELHSDGIQGYDGPWTTVVNSTIDFREADCGTAPFFFPKNQGNDGATVNRLLVLGGGYPFRMGVRGTVSGLKIVKGSWEYGPINVACSLVSAWDASIVTMTANYQVARTVRSQPCNTNDGS